MAKYYGKIGYGVDTEIRPGVWDHGITEIPYYGDVVRNVRNLQASGQVNDNINISNEISIVADPFAYESFHTIRYAEYMGVKWKVSNVEVLPPRLKLTLGGVYNENEA